MLIRSISGIRGIVETHLTDNVVRNYVRSAHQIYQDGAIIVGRDSRQSGLMITNTVIDEFIRLGRNVIFCDIVPTPTVQFMVGQTDAAGGLIVTASHNPEEWNGLKFVRADGTFFLPDENEKLFKIVDIGLKIEENKIHGIVLEDKNAIQKHIIKNVSLKCVDVNQIRQRQFKVVIDAINGAGAIAVPAMLEALGCEVIPINCEPTGDFVHGTEPLPHNLTELSKTVIDNDADIGFAIDPDADRLAVVDEKGKPVGEEYTLVLATAGYIKTTSRKETFVTNLSTTMALDKLAEQHNCTVERSAVGEINVVQKMLETGANLGGEGNGGVILREAHLGRDSLVGVTMALNRLAQSDEPISEIMQKLPQFEMIKDRLELNGADVGMSDPTAVFDRAKTIFSDAELNTVDGLKFIWNDRWLHLRASNTEPILRIYAEAPTKKDAQELVQTLKSTIS
ncbi:MAG: phosphoglucosamine mutase [Planctomycetia bacterium]|nr:phosphoglucosamine mutase [Planctomycetia bacterium]